MNSAKLPFSDMKNGDLTVRGTRADALDIRRFIKAEDMTAWEFSAYDVYGEARCDAENINDLSDLFGASFATAFHKHKDYLNAKHDLDGVLLRLREDQATADSCRKVIAEYERETQGAMPWEFDYKGNILCRFLGHKWRLMPGYPDHTGDEIFKCSRWNCRGWHG